MGSSMKKILLPVLIALSLVYFPSFWVNIAVFVDYYTPWVLFDSKIFDMYHQFLVNGLSERPEIPLPEIPAAEATYDRVFEVSKGFTFPVVVRQLLGNTTGVQNWGNHQWWINNYGDEELLCGTFSRVVEDCTIRGFFDALEKGDPFYVSGASVIFDRHPELHEMIDNDQIHKIEPAPERTSTQIFMGLPGMGSDIHCAVGINVFRQIVGRKKWWFIPPHQTAYLKPSINVNGFSSHTQTNIGKDGGKPSWWLSRLERYTIVLNPGDVLLNPPWFWHGIYNLPDENEKQDLVIGSPVRYGKSAATRAAFRTNFLWTLNSFGMLFYRYGPQILKPGFRFNLQQDIAGNRRTRQAEDTTQVGTTDEDPFAAAD